MVTAQKVGPGTLPWIRPCLLLTGRNAEIKSEVEVENYEFSDISTTYRMFQLENFEGIYYVHYFIALLLALVVGPPFRNLALNVHRMKLTSAIDIGISFFTSQWTWS